MFIFVFFFCLDFHYCRHPSSSRLPSSVAGCEPEERSIIKVVYPKKQSYARKPLSKNLNFMTKNMSNPYRMDANGRPHGLRRHDIKPITFFLYYLNFQSLFLLYDILPIFVTFPFLKTLFLKLKNTFLKTNRFLGPCFATKLYLLCCFLHVRTIIVSSVSVSLSYHSSASIGRRNMSLLFTHFFKNNSACRSE